MTEAGPSDAPRQHGLAVVVEEWFQGQALAAAVRRAHWPRLESRVEATVDAWLALLEHSATKATFFVDAFVAERRPALVARIAASGHELRGDRVEDALTARQAVRLVYGEELRRAADGEDALDDLARASKPCAFVFSAWELDATQPRITGASRRDQQRHYAGIDRVAGLVRHMLARFWPTSLEAAFGLQAAPLVVAVATGATAVTVAATMTQRVAVVVPMFDEAANVDYLLRSLDELAARGRDRYAFEFVLVDDRSRDATWELLQRACRDRSDVKLVRHERNRGVAAAILSGIEAATCDVVASIDCDGSYDPLDLLAMVPLLDSAAMVTASPYHPQGGVRNVPAWRLLLSKTLSRIYRIVLRSELHTFTSCCRVHRRDAMVGMRLLHEGFLGMAEMLVRVLRCGGVVHEYPTTLSSRLLGYSKMKTLRTIRGHVGLLVAVMVGRVR